MSHLHQAGRSLAIVFFFGAMVGAAASEEPVLVSRSEIPVEGITSAIALSEDGTMLAHAPAWWGRELRLVRTDDGGEVHRVGFFETPIADASFNRDGSMLAVVGTANISPIMGWKFTPIGEAGRMGLGKGSVDPDTYSRRDAQGLITPRMPMILSGKSTNLPPMQGRVYTIDLREDEPKLTVVARDSSPLPAVKVAADRSSIGVLDHDLKLRSVATAAREPFDLAAGREESEEHVNTENEFLVPSATFSDDAKRVVTIPMTYSGKFVFRLFDPSTGEMETLDPRGQAGTPWTVDLSPDGRRFVSAGAGPRVCLWDYEKREKVGEFANSQDPDAHVKYVKFSGDASRILTFDDRNVARLWRADGSRLITQFEVEERALRRATVHEDRIVLVFGGNRPAFAKIPSVPAAPITVLVYKLQP